MKQLRVEANHPYMVHIGAGAFDLFANAYRPLLDNADRIVVIVDKQVAELHLPYLLAHLTDWDVRVLTIPAGESAKSVETFMACHSFLLSENCSRASLLLAFGGGATGDVAGFVASTFMRGISFIQLPTTILAHDSAVGGKTAINHKLGKNMIGTFYQPKAVLYDSKLLATLPVQEVRSGMAEVIKHAFISNEEWLNELLAIENFKDMTEDDLNRHLEKGIAVKAAIVEEDEFEGGIRKYLNFGHTLAHALEGHLGYGKLTHGEAVVLGMSYALLLSEHSKLAGFIRWSSTNGYPLHLLQEIHFEALLPYMKKDKKSSRGTLNFVLLERTGKPFVEQIEEQHARATYEKLVLQIGEVIR
ncbi:3-dehydroquinate synthase [Planococcus sp. ANT_H30]|uniref:3-dehydroquinate synthase n=1 Tax=Planococcus kocurii TaxID=1374 RepID=A0ABM5WVL3_9BACL|nr:MULTISPECIES: 3-dehydroquinate synthase [Planococcus]ALS78384.1 3-dehydroquinate synthase [Planococcus kocurii]KAA0958206.1 3-dehydroquinate synthase [Planococcus sp. ANT_H30]